MLCSWFGVDSCHQTRFLGSKYHGNAVAVGAVCGIPLGSLHHFSANPQLDLTATRRSNGRGKGKEGKVREWK